MPIGEPKTEIKGKRENNRPPESMFDTYSRVAGRLRGAEKIENPQEQRVVRTSALQELLALHKITERKPLGAQVRHDIRRGAEFAYGPVNPQNLQDVIHGYSQSARIVGTAENQRSLADLAVIKGVAPLFLGHSAENIVASAEKTSAAIQNHIDIAQERQRTVTDKIEQSELAKVRSGLEELNIVDPNSELESESLVAEELKRYPTENDKKRLRELPERRREEYRRTGTSSSEIKIEFAQNATPEQKRLLSAIQEELGKLSQETAAARKKVTETLRKSPCLTHVTTLQNAIRTTDQGLHPVSETGNGMYDEYDKQFPELGLRDVVHCGWGGIDQFSIQDPDTTVVLLLDASAVSPGDKITRRDWSRWGPMYMGKIGGGPNAARQAVKEYINQLEPADKWHMDPYDGIGQIGLEFITKGRRHEAGELDVPTALVPAVPSAKILGAIVGDAAGTTTITKDHLQARIPVFSWKELEGVRIDPVTGETHEYLQLSQQARFAEAKLTGSGDEFASVFLNKPGTTISNIRDAEEKIALLLGLRTQLYWDGHWPGGKTPKL